MIHLIPFMLAGQADLAKKADARYEEAVKEGFSGSVLVVKGGKVVLAKAYGFADPVNKVPNTPSTIFAIGSVTKWFTGMVTLKLEQDGKLKLSDTIDKYVPGVPADKKGITIAMLLSHSAGLAEYVDRPGEGGDFAAIDRKTALGRILGDKLAFAPGSRSEYSNAGYTLLAMIIEKASGRTWQECVRKFVFVPAGMTRSGFFGEQKWPAKEFAVGFNAKVHGKVNSPYYWGPMTWSIVGAGGIVSTTGDLGKAILALTQGKILNMATEPRMFQAIGKGHEGMGWMVGQTKAGTPFCNVGGGDNFGFFCGVNYLPNEGNVVISCINSDRPMKMSNANLDVLRMLM